MSASTSAASVSSGYGGMGLKKKTGCDRIFLLKENVKSILEGKMLFGIRSVRKNWESYD